ncbi:MAG: translation initiation factor eIF-1A [Candidatus Kariarchaeaceae archaeon]
MGQVIQNLGGRLLLVRCVDGHTRQVSIPGRYRRRMWTRVGDVIITIPQYGLNPDNKGTLEHRYTKNESQMLYERELIPEEYIL